MTFGFAGQLAPPASHTPPEKRCSISGRVSSAATGEPVKKANIRLVMRGGNATGGTSTFLGPSPSVQGYGAVSDADGAFHIDGIEPGQYELSVQKGGFLIFNYGAKSLLHAGTVLTLAPGQQMTNLSLALSPQAVISGKVVDSDGDPVEGGNVQALSLTWMLGRQQYQPRGAAQVNDVGEYRIAGLPPGRYYVCVRPLPNSVGVPAPGQPDIRSIRTCYPSAPTLANATPIDVKAGQDSSGMNIQIQQTQTYHVRGKVVGALPSGAVERGVLNLTPRDEDGSFLFNGQSGVKPNGSFDVAGVAPGSYVLNLFLFSGQIRTLARINVDVGAGDVNGVELPIVPNFTLRGRVRIEGTPPAGSQPADLSHIRLHLFAVDAGMMFRGMQQAKMGSDGSFTIDDVAPGKYTIQTSSPLGTYLASVLYGATDILKKELDLSGGAGGELDLVFHYGAAEVDGSIKPTQDNGTSPQAPPPAEVFLIPDVLNADGTGIQFSNSDNNGGFTFKQVPPGHYRAYAFEQIESNALQNPDLLKALESTATDVQVKENDKLQIQLPFISADELHRITTQAGLAAE